MRIHIEKGAHLLSPSLQAREGQQIPTEAASTEALNEIENALKLEFPEARLIYKGGHHLAVHQLQDRDIFITIA